MGWKSRSRPPAHVPKNPRTHYKMKPEIREDMAKLSNYIPAVEIRELDVERTKGTPGFLEGEDTWMWIKQDSGAMYGPDKDWLLDHKDKYFKYLKNTRVVVSAGANHGMYIRFFAKKFETVYAFEPDPLNFHCMVVNNQVDNVVKIQGALGEKTGFCAVVRSSFQNTGEWSVVTRDEDLPFVGKRTVPIFAIDDMNFEVLDLLQLDTEGSEDKALLGAQRTIGRCKPVVVVENGDKPTIIKIMTDLEYRSIDQSKSDRIFVPNLWGWIEPSPDLNFPPS